MLVRKCNICLKIKDLSEFYRTKKGYIRTICKKCYKECYVLKIRKANLWKLPQRREERSKLYFQNKKKLALY